MRMFSVMNVSQVRGKLGLAPVSHTLNNSCDLVLRNQHRYLLQHCIEGWGFLDAIIMRWTLFLKCHRHAKIEDMPDEQTDQSVCTRMFLLILVRCVLALSS